MILKLLIGIFCFITVYLLWRISLLKKGIRQTTAELSEVSGQLGDNRVIKLPFPDEDMAALLRAINQNLEDIRREHLRFEKKEEAFRQEMENISHDLRTPLTAIIGYLRMIDKRNLTDIEKDYLETALRRAGKMQELTSRFYELSQVTDKEYQVELQTIDAAQILRETCLDYYSLMEERKLFVELNIPHQEADIWGNQEALERVIMNLLQNAVRYAKSIVKIDLQVREEKVWISFENDISSEDVQVEANRLFERFYMQESFRGHGGSGLGLTISKELVNHMNGQITGSYVEKAEEKHLVIMMEFEHYDGI